LLYIDRYVYQSKKERYMSPRTAEANEAIHEDRRGQLLDAALSVFVERGFAGTRMQEIAERAKLSYGLVYHYFPSKEAIFSALVDLALGAAESLIGSLSPDSSPEDFGSFVGYAIADPSPSFFALIIEALTKEGVPPELESRARKVVLGIRDSFAKVLPSPEAGGEASTRAEGLVAILLGASIMKICGVSDGSFAAGAARILAIKK
jgi:AcrR family transcriptional regulator